MARRRKGPWRRASDSCWYTTVGRRSVKLGERDTPYEDVERAYHEVHAKKEKPRDLLVVRLFEDFLEHCQRHRSPRTHAWYANYLNSFSQFVGPRLRVDSVTPRQVNNWINECYQEASDSTQHAAARCVVRAMNWAIAERLIRNSPLAGYTKPSPGKREVAITPAQFKTCLEKSKEPLNSAISFLWETGCRPQELRIIEAAWIDGPKVTIPAKLSKGGKKGRVIYLSETALEITTRLAGEWPSGPVFRNSSGTPWTKDAFTCAFRRLREKTNIEGLCAYAFRHGFATEALKRGIDTTTVGVLMGHSNPGMVARTYQHLAQDDRFLLQTLNGVADQLGNRPVA